MSRISRTISQEEPFKNSTIRQNSTLIRKCDQQKRFAENSFITISRIDTTNLNRSRSSKIGSRNNSCMNKSIYGENKINWKQAKIKNMRFQKTKSTIASRKARLYQLAILQHSVQIWKEERESSNHCSKLPLSKNKVIEENGYNSKPVNQSKMSNILESVWTYESDHSAVTEKSLSTDSSLESVNFIMLPKLKLNIKDLYST